MSHLEGGRLDGERYRAAHRTPVFRATMPEITVALKVRRDHGRHPEGDVPLSAARCRLKK